MTNEKQSAIAAHMELVDDLVRNCGLWTNANDKAKAKLEVHCLALRAEVEKSARSLAYLK